jgi:hypothetical protein
VLADTHEINAKGVDAARFDETTQANFIFDELTRERREVVHGILEDAMDNFK